MNTKDHTVTLPADDYRHLIDIKKEYDKEEHERNAIIIKFIQLVGVKRGDGHAYELIVLDKHHQHRFWCNGLKYTYHKTRITYPFSEKSKDGDDN